MAKINARGAREVARWEAFYTVTDITPGDESIRTTRWLFLLRSDGKVLRRLADQDLSGGYSIFASFKPTDNKSQDGARKLTPAELTEARKGRVERMLTNKGYRWTAQRVRV
jgi:hypothetical protein